jgi:glycosyltransferase involved in cell wall biosynthesis
MPLDRVVDLPRRGLWRRKRDFIALADQARDARNWDLAAQLYREALDRDPRNSGIWVQYGHALKESGELRDPDKLARADLAYRRAISLDPGTADPHLHLGHVLKLQGKTNEAQASYLRAFALDRSIPYPGQELSGLGWSDAHLLELEEMLGSDVSNSRRFSSEDWSVSENVNELAPQYPPSVEPCAAVSIRETEVDVPTEGGLGLTGETRSREEPCDVSRSPVTILKSGNAFRLVYISGEPETPGHRYRVLRPMAAAKTLGAVVTCMQVEEIPARLAEIERANAVVFWRAAWNQHVASAVETARYGGAKIIFDVDDLMVEPRLARVEVIDGIRSMGMSEAQVRDHFERFRRTMTAADMCTATTEELAAHMRQGCMPTMVIPNGFDHGTWAVSRLAARRRSSAGPGDGLVRIGYASGSRTHQRDFAVCAGAVAEALRGHPECRLVAFRSADGSASTIDIEEFPALRGLEHKIEWRNLVPPEKLPEELSRFDINLAPLEVGNPFCEAKSELKFFEAALAGVVTIASPTGPYRRAIRHDQTGFLAATPSDWREALTKLVTDPGLRRRISDAARRDVLWSFGPERMRQAMAFFLDLVRGGRYAAQGFELDVLRRHAERAELPLLPKHEVVFETDHLGAAQVTVVVPLYNYAELVGEALNSVAAQTLRGLDLIVIDDSSTDDSLLVALDWARANATRFDRICVVRNRANVGLGATRNVGFDLAETPFVLPLDADNRLLPGCVAACLETIQTTGAAFAYPQIKTFGAVEELRGVPGYDPVRLANGNYIDAMALISKAVWAAVGGYDHVRTGWEDFDFWCKLAEHGLRGEQVLAEPLAEYRIHSNSMLQSAMARPETVRAMMDHLEGRHPWLTLIWPVPISSQEVAEASPPPAAGAGLDQLLDLPEAVEIAAKYAVYSGIHRGDFIYEFNASNCSTQEQGVEYYFMDGQRSARQLDHLITRYHKASGDRISLLEFASGYGCVTRHLKMLGDRYDVLACDIHEAAVDFIRDHIGVTALLSRRLPEQLDLAQRFNIVFALSFFSHMPPTTFAAWARRLFDFVTPGGLLIFTTHGRAGHAAIGNPDFSPQGYCFFPNSEQKDLPTADYGTMVIRPRYAFEAMRSAVDAMPVFFEEAFWWGHQDTFIFRKSQT